MKASNIFLPLAAIAVLGASLGMGLLAVADSWQSQSQSPSGASQSSSSGSSGTDSNDADYAVWPNGGGKVHHNAKVDASVTVSKGSKVGSFVVIEKGATITKSILQGESDAKPAKVGQGAVVESSTLQGAFSIGDQAKVLGTMLQGPIAIKGGVTVDGCTLSAMNASTVKRDVSKQMLMLQGD